MLLGYYMTHACSETPLSKFTEGTCCHCVCSFGYGKFIFMGDFWDAWWQQTYQVKSIVFGNVRMLRLRKQYNFSQIPLRKRRLLNEVHCGIDMDQILITS